MPTLTKDTAMSTLSKLKTKIIVIAAIALIILLSSIQQVHSQFSLPSSQININQITDSITNSLKPEIENTIKTTLKETLETTVNGISEQIKDEINEISKDVQTAISNSIRTVGWKILIGDLIGSGIVTAFVTW